MKKSNTSFKIKGDQAVLLLAYISRQEDISALYIDDSEKLKYLENLCCLLEKDFNTKAEMDLGSIDLQARMAVTGNDNICQKDENIAEAAVNSFSPSR